MGSLHGVVDCCSIMSIMGVLRNIFILCTSGVLVTTSALNCYFCTNNPDGDGYRPYDPACGDRDYHGNQTRSSYDNCATLILADGYISRSIWSGNEDDGECSHY